MKTKLFFLALFLSMGIVSCDDKDEKKEEKKEKIQPIECACNSEKVGEISGEGTITFFKPDKEDQKFFHYYGNQFWVTVEKENFSSHYIVCNHDFLKRQFDYLKQTKKSVKVKFRGIQRRLCKNSPGIVRPMIGSYMHSHAIIELTSIEEL